MEGVEAHPEFLRLKKQCEMTTVANGALISQVEKYRAKIERLTAEKRFLVEKLATIEYDDEFEVSDDDDSDSEPALKRQRTTTTTISTPRRRSKADGPSQMCAATRRDGSQCKSKAIAGSQFCWVGG